MIAARTHATGTYLLALLIAWAVFWISPATANDKELTLTAPTELADSGLLKFMLPRFSLKTGVRVTIGENGALAITDSPPGVPIISRGDAVFYLGEPEDAAAARFADWLVSDVGRRTLESFAPESGPVFTAYAEQQKTEEVQSFDGDANTGEEISLSHCGRCHVINERNRMNGLGSTPSFSVLRSLSDWPYRFEVFYVLNPHPSFTQIEGVTAPFDKTRPSPIAPVEMTLDDLDAILAFVAAMAPADLGAPIQHQ